MEHENLLKNFILSSYSKYEKDYSDLFIYAPAGGVITQKNKFKGKPFLLVAAGPSLETLLPYLPELKKRIQFSFSGHGLI